MDSIFNDEIKINIYAKIQNNLSTLKGNSTEEEINAIFDQIHPSFFDEKQNTIMICQFFGMIGRYRRQMGRVTLKLFEKIMHYIKRDLHDESSLFWNIFGSCSYFKYWMYKEGLIDINQILISSQSDETSLTAEYFLPEILENDSEFFHKELKHKFPCFSSENSYSIEKVEKLKILREKHLKWLKESGDYNDESYREIEHDPIRLAIKTDDISTFQMLLSRSNLSINSSISESVIEHFLRTQIEMHLIDYAANYCAFNIFNFLILNGAKIEIGILNFVIHSDNYYMIHIVESKISQTFRDHAIFFAIIGWNFEFIKYIIENYGYDYLDNENDEEESDDEIIENKNEENENQKEDENKNETKNEEENEENKNETKNEEEKNENQEDDENKNETKNKEEENENKKDDENASENKNENDEEQTNNNPAVGLTKTTSKYDEVSVIKIIDNTIYCYNLYFFKKTLLPFIRKNPQIIKNNFQVISASSFTDLSFYFTDQLVHYKMKGVNPFMSNRINSLLTIAIDNNNTRAIEKLIDFPNVDPNGLFFYCCANFTNMKIIEIFSHHNDFDCNFRHPMLNISIFQVSMIKGNVFVLRFLIKNFQDLKPGDVFDEILYCIKFNHFMSLKIYVEYLIDKCDSDEFQKIIDKYIASFAKIRNNESFISKFTQIIDEVRKNRK